MPTRLIREGINSSPRINALSPGAEILYRRLMSVVDDYGRYYAAPGTVRGACWPTAPEKVHEAQLMEWLAECSTGERPLIRIYYVNGCKYLEVTDFGQKPRSKSKFPEPDGNYEETKEISVCEHFANNCLQSDADCSIPMQVADNPQRNASTMRNSYSDAYTNAETDINPCATDVALVSADPAPSKVTAIAKADEVREWYFAEFYPAYPLHKGREDGLKAARKHLRTPELRKRALCALRAQLQELNSREPSKRPYPASWIHGKRWEDEPTPLFVPAVSQQYESNTDRAIKRAYELHEQGLL